MIEPLTIFANAFASFGDTIGIFAVLFGLVGCAGGAVGYFAKGRGDSIIAYQAKEMELQGKTIKRLELDNAALTRERDTLKEQNSTLTALAQGSPELVKLTNQIRNLVQVVAKISKGAK